MSINAIEIEQARLRISDTAQSMLDGECSYIDGARRICGMLAQAKLDSFELPFVTFVGIDSEIGEMPVGRLRECWHPDAKIKFASKWAQAENYAKNHGEAACRDAIAWLATHPSWVR